MQIKTIHNDTKSRSQDFLKEVINICKIYITEHCK